MAQTGGEIRFTVVQSWWVVPALVVASYVLSLVVVLGFTRFASEAVNAVGGFIARHGYTLTRQ